jgi:hypothetical protein
MQLIVLLKIIWEETKNKNKILFVFIVSFDLFNSIHVRLESTKGKLNEATC